MLTLSYTQIAAYQQCPLAYKLQYIDGLKPPAKWYFSFGETLHTCAQYFFSAMLPAFPSLEQFLAYYLEKWNCEGWESADQEAAEKAYGEQILRDFWQIHSRAFRIPLATERQFTVNIEGVRLRGYIDRIDKLGTSGLSIVDYKSNRELFTKDYVDGLLQLTLYQMACERMWDMSVEQLTLYHLRTNTAVSSGPRTRECVRDATKLVLSVAKGIESGNFPATENQFCPCDFLEHCPYHRNRYGDTVPESQKPDMLRGVAIDAVVERYTMLQEEQKLLEKEIAELKEILIQYCEIEQVNRVFGSEHSITYKVVERTGYNEREVKAFLEPANLWDRVLKFDSSAVKELIMSDDVPEEIKRKLESLSKVVSTYPRLFIKTFKGDRDE